MRFQEKVTTSPSLPAFRTLGHGTVLVEGPPRIVVDPWRLQDRDVGPADLVLVTDGHIDHCSGEDLAAVYESGSRVVAPTQVVARLVKDFAETALTALEPGECWSRAGVTVRALPASAPPRAHGFLTAGAALTYLLETPAAERLLFLGASDALPEHEGLSPDVAFFAVGGFTMPTPEEAADAAARVRPRLAVPTHWGDLSARYVAAQRFVALCRERGIDAVAVAPAQSEKD